MSGATLAQTDGHELYAWCFACRSGAWLDRPALIAQLGSDAEIPAIAERLKCSRCGAVGEAGITLHHHRPAR